MSSDEKRGREERGEKRAPGNIRPGVGRVFQLATRKRDGVANEASDEVLFHLQERQEQLIAQGLNETAARTEAERRFGNVVAAKDSLVVSSERLHRRNAWKESFSSVALDVQFALRSLRRSPSFVAIALACLTLGIGANVAIFAVVDGVLLKPLPFQNPSQLVRVWGDAGVPSGIYEIIERESKSYAMLEGAERALQQSMTGIGEPTRVMVSQTTAGIFNALGVSAVVGRAFDPGDNEVSAPQRAVLSHANWRSRFGGDSSVVGKTVKLDGVSRTIAGVMPPQFSFPDASVQLWVPASFARTSPGYWWTTYFTLIGRLKPGVTVEQARTEAAVVFPRARSAFPMRMPDRWGANVDVIPLQESVVKASRSTMVLLYGAVGLVLLVACVNVAGLYIARTILRSREIAVRTALGAGRARIARLLMVESALIAVMGAASGLAFASLLLRGLVSVLPSDTPRLAEIAIDGRVLAMTLVLSVGTAVIFGLLPLLYVARRDFASALRSDSRSGSSRVTARASWALAVAQVALAVTLVASAGLLVKSLWQLQSVDLGFATTNVLSAEIPLPAFANDSAARTPQFYDAVVQQARAIPGVTAVAIASSLPFGDGIQTAAMETEAHPAKPGEVGPLPQLSSVSADYFRVLNIPLLRGRMLNDADRSNTLRVGVIDEAGARAFWPNGEAIGQRIRFVWDKEWFTIVGVVGNVKRDSLSSQSQPSLYLPSSQTFARPMRVVIQSSLPAAIIGSSLRAAVARVDATVPVGETVPLSRIVNGSAARQRFAALLLAAFGITALLLGAVGIYGVVNASVQQRTREIGVRMALGATKQNVLRTVLEQSFVISGVGVVVGFAGSLASAKLLRGLLFGVSATDFTVLSAVVVLLAVVSVGAALAPALRASRVDPLTAIRAE
ncbi:MAG: ABC transporter permease [Gemmatimonadaceae bacterium]